ncbi:MAG: Uma2 family endonuclease [Ardenticatenia bacterium]|nr:Uma2 family endonuclease [Ardenticatenia bacterium]
MSESTVSQDRALKVPLYGRHGVVEVWVVDVEGEVVEVYREPSAEGDTGW